MYSPILIDQQRKRQVRFLLNLGCFCLGTLDNGQYLRLFVQKPGIVCRDLCQNLEVGTAISPCREYQYQVGTPSIIGETNWLPESRGESEITNQLPLRWACLRSIGHSAREFSLCHFLHLSRSFSRSALCSAPFQRAAPRPALTITCARSGPHLAVHRPS